MKAKPSVPCLLFASALFWLVACASEDASTSDAAPPSDADAQGDSTVTDAPTIVQMEDAAPVTTDGGADVMTPPEIRIEGNVDLANLPQKGSVGFVLVGNRYALFQNGAALDTAIAFISPDSKKAWGWHRTKPLTDPSSKDVAFELDLATGGFTDIVFPDSRASIVRGGWGRKLVGKMILENNTPGNRMDDTRHGFIYDLDSKKLHLYAREGFSDIGFTSLNGSGTIVGFNNFGALGFVYANGIFQDLKHASAYRLFPFAIDGRGRIVGFWGKTENDWLDNTAMLAFIAEPAADGSHHARPLEFPGFVAGGLSGLNESGAWAGVAYRTKESLAVLIRGTALEGAVESVPFPGNGSPFATGIHSSGAIYGQIFINETPKPCAGHGSLNAGVCACDAGYVVDVYDEKNCIAIGAECSGHGHKHGDGRCHCDKGYRADPTDATKCKPI